MKYKESIVNFLNTVLMKTFLNYLFVLCPSIVIYGCSNDDKDMVICPYPSFECENAKGDLIYDTENKQQEIHLAPDGETLISSIEDHGSHVWDRYRLN